MTDDKGQGCVTQGDVGQQYDRVALASLFKALGKWGMSMARAKATILVPQEVSIKAHEAAPSLLTV